MFADAFCHVLRTRPDEARYDRRVACERRRKTRCKIGRHCHRGPVELQNSTGTIPKTRSRRTLLNDERAHTSLATSNARLIRIVAMTFGGRRGRRSHHREPPGRSRKQASASAPRRCRDASRPETIRPAAVLVRQRPPDTTRNREAADDGAGGSPRVTQPPCPCVRQVHPGRKPEQRRTGEGRAGGDDREQFLTAARRRRQTPRRGPAAQARQEPVDDPAAKRGRRRRDCWRAPSARTPLRR